MKLLHWILGILLFGLTLGLGFGVEQSDFYPLIGLYFAFFGIYVWICQTVKEKKTIQFYIGLGIVLRFALLFAFPNLSDDVCRFIWDGRLINAGINPFVQLPSFYIENYQGIPINGITLELFDQLNSPNYFTIYPPIAQGIFALATYLFPNSLWGSAFVMKLFLFFCELGSIYFLAQFFKNQLSVLLWYVLNPLIILEVCGNLHFEGAMICFLLGAVYFLFRAEKKRENKLFVFSGILFASSIASKLLPLLFLPLLIRPLGWKRSIHYFLIVGGTTLLLFLPLLNMQFLANFAQSLDLYFQRFEFNASLYYVLRWIGFQWKGYNLIAFLGPLLGLLAFGGIFYLAFSKNYKKLYQFPSYCLGAIAIYLVCTTTVHPWYTALPIVFCLFTNFRFPILWSGLIFLTYINYSYPSYFENLWMVRLEYIGLFSYALWEFFGKKVRNA